VHELRVGRVGRTPPRRASFNHSFVSELRVELSDQLLYAQAIERIPVVRDLLVQPVESA